MNEYLAYFPWDTLSDKIIITKLSKTLLNSMINTFSEQAYVQGFYCESIPFEKYVNMFERMEISESA